jgi:hypothetical protein
MPPHGGGGGVALKVHESCLLRVYIQSSDNNEDSLMPCGEEVKAKLHTDSVVFLCPCYVP